MECGRVIVRFRKRRRQQSQPKRRLSGECKRRRATTASEHVICYSIRTDMLIGNREPGVVEGEVVASQDYLAPARVPGTPMGLSLGIPNPRRGSVDKVLKKTTSSSFALCSLQGRLLPHQNLVLSTQLPCYQFTAPESWTICRGRPTGSWRRSFLILIE